MNNEIKNYLKENYPNNNYIFGPNWAIIKPTNDELENEDKNSHYHSIEKECILCHSKFSYGQTKKILCGCCKIITQCINNNCNKVFEIDLMNYSGSKQKEIIDSLKNNKKIFISCSKSCSNMVRVSHGICPTCGSEDVDIYNKRCTYCANKELNAPINCIIHGYQKKIFWR